MNYKIISVIIILFFSFLFSADKCNRCNKSIKDQYLVLKAGKYHIDCHKCNLCKQKIEGKYNIHENENYHKECYRNHILPKCNVCTKPLDSEYFIDDWDNKYHAYHLKEIGNCTYCHRVISDNTTGGGIKIQDGRKVCNLCNISIVDTEDEKEESRKRVLEQLYEIGFTDIPDNIPIYILNRDKLNKKYSGYDKNDSKKNDKLNLAGLADYKSVWSGRDEDGNKVNQRKYYVIYMLDNMPAKDFDGVLAHEYLHVWQFHHNLNYPNSINEGFCNLGKFSMYNLSDDRLSSIKIEQMEKNPHPDYGVGYRKMKNCLSSKGWKKLIKETKKGNAYKCN